MLQITSGERRKKYLVIQITKIQQTNKTKM